MSEKTKIDIAKALRCRFEADAILGARVLPVRISEPVVAVGQRGVGAEGSAGGSVHSGGREAARAEARGSSSPESAVAATPLRPAVSPEEAGRRGGQLESIDNNEVKTCTRCGLAGTRTKTVFGVGSATARIVFVGEAPGHDEDVSGEPFVGRAGQLLTKMIQQGMGLRRKDVYICNVLKCRPPENRSPATNEIVACQEYLWRQIEAIQPEVIVALGAPAAQTLLGTREGIGRLRGRFHDFYPSGSTLIGEPIPLLPTYHPAYLLRSPAEKVKAWADLKLVMARLGIPIPKRR
jgi:DNA polymerase